jgi:hypothetical protein
MPVLPDCEAAMQQNPDKTGPANPLAKLIGQLPTESTPGIGTHLWQRLNMEAVARRVIQTARSAAAEHTLQRAEEVIRHRDWLRGKPATT